MGTAELARIADAADFIVNGYAFTACDQGVRVLNLNKPDRAAVLSLEGELLETSMDDIELGIVRDFFLRNKEFLAA